MGAYSYKALNEEGKTVKGILEGDSERHIRTQLRAKKLKPLEVLGAGSEAQASANEGLDISAWSRRRASRLSTRELSLITRQLASLVKSGLPLDEALHATAKQSQKANVKRVVLQVRTKVLEGFSLAQALGDNPVADVGRFVDCNDVVQQRVDRFLRRSYRSTVYLRNARPAVPGAFALNGAVVLNPYRHLDSAN